MTGCFNCGHTFEDHGGDPAGACQRCSCECWQEADSHHQAAAPAGVCAYCQTPVLALRCACGTVDLRKFLDSAYRLAGRRAKVPS